MNKLLKFYMLGVLLGLGACTSLLSEQRGFVAQEQKLKVSAGMSPDEVRKVIGAPFNIVKYRNEPQPMWIYHAGSTLRSDILFYVEFGADGKVRSVSEREVIRETPTWPG